MVQENFQLITYQKNGRIAEITLNRPEKRNAFNAALVDELKTAFTIANDDDYIRVVVLGARGKVFSAGADLQYLQSLQHNTYEENLADSTSLMELYKMIYTLQKPVVAKIQGSAIAGGCGLASVCDYSIAIQEAQFGYTEVKIGFIPAIVMVFLVRKIGEGAARDLLLSGKLISATEAVQIGLINAVCEESALEQRVLSYAAAISNETSPQAVAMTKKMMAQLHPFQLSEALLFAASMNANARSTSDCKAGIAAFLAKEKMPWNVED